MGHKSISKFLLAHIVEDAALFVGTFLSLLPIKKGRFCYMVQKSLVWKRDEPTVKMGNKFHGGVYGKKTSGCQRGLHVIGLKMGEKFGVYLRGESYYLVNGTWDRCEG